MQLVEATKENGVVITSSPGLIPAATIIACSPAVPDETPTPCLRPAIFAHPFSNSSILGPMDKVEPCKTSMTASMSAGAISGCESGIEDMALGGMINFAFASCQWSWPHSPAKGHRQSTCTSQHYSPSSPPPPSQP